MIKKITTAMILLAVMLLAGCNKNDKLEGIPDNLRYSENEQMVMVAEEGVFYRGKDELIHYRPTGETEDMILCYDPGCSHLPASHDNPDPECRAALFEGRTDITYYEGYIYFFVQDGIFKHKIYRMAVNGSGRELIAEIPYYHNIIQGVAIYEDRMYYPVYENVADKAADKIYSTQYILEYNLADGTYRLITKKTGDAVITIQATKNYVFLRMASTEQATVGCLYLKRVNVNTLEEDIIINTDDYQINSFVRAYDDDNFIYYKFENIVGIRNISTGKDRILIDETDRGTVGLLTASGNGIFYCVGETDESGNGIITAYYFYDILTGKTTDISDKGFEYGLTGYNGFKKVFTADMGYNKMTISEEKVLGSRD